MEESRDPSIKLVFSLAYGPKKEVSMGSEDSRLYLTDAQYRRILGRIEEVINSPNFVVSCFDSTFPGDKYTESNCGFCNEGFTELDTSLFPSQFPERKSLKYRRSNHKCPFDTRKKPDLLGWGNGCFSKCYLFKTRGKEYDLEVMRSMVKELIDPA